MDHSHVHGDGGTILHRPIFKDPFFTAPGGDNFV